MQKGPTNLFFFYFKSINDMGHVKSFFFPEIHTHSCHVGPSRSAVTVGLHNLACSPRVSAGHSATARPRRGGV